MSWRSASGGHLAHQGSRRTARRSVERRLLLYLINDRRLDRASGWLQWTGPAALGDLFLFRGRVGLLRAAAVTRTPRAHATEHYLRVGRRPGVEGDGSHQVLAGLSAEHPRLVWSKQLVGMLAFPVAGVVSEESVPLSERPGCTPRLAVACPLPRPCKALWLAE